MAAALRTLFSLGWLSRRVLIHRSMVGALALALVAGCVRREPAEIVQLEVSSLGTYAVNGVPVDLQTLSAVLLSHKRAGDELLVRVIPLQGAKYESVYAAVEAAQKAGARVGMVGNEASDSSPPSSSAHP